MTSCRLFFFDANGNFWTRRKNTEDSVEGVLTVGVEAVRRSLFDLVQNLRNICVEWNDRQTSEQKIRKKNRNKKFFFSENGKEQKPHARKSRMTTGTIAPEICRYTLPLVYRLQVSK